ncbi:hypothetical protein EDD36DRAFT_478748 [Exophiala viscosa]|uniref:Uncharacterized protein n=1 Tax=Exophiala viscosa TaxID=2486360 RepID=A0AAN6DPP6_9EURO|nr:hypothetical protein EDD36DRAFT_478748 [Exophiala viscosa]
MYGFRKFSWILVSTNIWFSTSFTYNNEPYCNTKDAECFFASCDERIRIDIISNRWAIILLPPVKLETNVFAIADCRSAIMSTINLKPVNAIGFGLKAIDIAKEDKETPLPWLYIRSAAMSQGDIQARITNMGECGHPKIASNSDSVFCISSSVGNSGAVAITLVQFLEDCTELEFVREIGAIHAAQPTYEDDDINGMINCDTLASVKEDDSLVIALHGASNHTPWPHLNGEPEPDSPVDIPFLCTIRTGWTVEKPHLAFETNLAICVFLASFLATMAWLRHWRRGATARIRSPDVHQVCLPKEGRATERTYRPLPTMEHTVEYDV